MGVGFYDRAHYSDASHHIFFVPIFLFLVRSSFIPRVLESCWQGVHSTLMDDIIHLIRGEIPVGEREWVHYLAPSTSAVAP